MHKRAQATKRIALTEEQWKGTQAKLNVGYIISLKDQCKVNESDQSEINHWLCVRILAIRTLKEKKPFTHMTV